MADDFEDDTAGGETGLEEKLPDWYREIFPAGPCDGFYEKLGEHALIHVARDPATLVVTFDNLSDAGYPGYDIRPWAEKFIRDNGWSHLGVVAQGPTWFRDARLIARMEALRDQGFFEGYARVVMAGTSMGGFGALAFADLAPGCEVVAFSPQTTLARALVPWERRFARGRDQDWSLPRSDAAEHSGKAAKVWVICDPFLQDDMTQFERLTPDNVTLLKAFGLGHKTALVLRRMELLKAVMARAVTGELSESWYYQATRNRKDIYLYRKVMEEHLGNRGKEDRIPRLVAAFKARRLARDAATPPAPEPPAEPDKPRPAQAARQEEPVQMITQAPAAPRRPRTLGNVWNLTDDGQALRYMSDQYRGRTMGFEERNGLTMAQTPQVALGMVSLGAGCAVPRALPERFDYHLRDEDLGQDAALLGAEGQGVASLAMTRARGHALRTTVALSRPQAGITEGESQPDAPLFEEIAGRVATARASLAMWDKLFFVDRISLDLLAGSPGLSELRATAHYIEAITDLKDRVARAAGQDSLPLAVVSQKPGTRVDGSSEVILAEGRLDIHEPGLGVLVATPTYMLDFLEDSVATLSPAARLWVDEMEALAVDAALNGRKWYCPSLRQVFAQGNEIVAEFATMGALEFDNSMSVSEHGFTLEGCENGASITGLRLGAPQPGSQRVILTFDRAPEGAALKLSYAFGVKRDKPDGSKPANFGALRETWERDSLLQPGRKLRRYALSGRLPVMPSDLSEAP